MNGSVSLQKTVRIGQQENISCALPLDLIVVFVGAVTDVSAD